jgi:hypothetical protein
LIWLLSLGWTFTRGFAFPSWNVTSSSRSGASPSTQQNPNRLMGTPSHVAWTCGCSLPIT